MICKDFYIVAVDEESKINWHGGAVANENLEMFHVKAVNCNEAFQKVSELTDKRFLYTIDMKEVN